MTLTETMLQMLDHMESRPEMYAQTVGELECQYHLLLSLLNHAKDGNSEAFREARTRTYLKRFGVGNIPMASHIHEKAFKTAVDVLRDLRSRLPFAGSTPKTGA